MPEKREILYRNRSTVRVGELNRFIIEYTPKADDRFEQDNEKCLWLRVKNTEALPLRAAYLAGPYILYVDMRPGDYDQNVKLFSTAEQPAYESQLKAGQSFYAQLYMHKIQEKYTWTVDVVSQILFSTNASVQFEVLVGHHKEDLHQTSTVVDEGEGKSGIKVRKLDTLDIWHSPTPKSTKPAHLVVITHGLHSNTGADMLFVKEKIDEMARKTGENIIVRGFHGNACKTEKGIKYLGKRVGDYVLNELVTTKNRKSDGDGGGFTIDKISFVGHSLGGLVQTFAIAHIQSHEPDFFDKVRPINFITMATPHLGISNENPGYIKFALDIGFAGKTGQDLGLTWKPSTKKNHKPLLQVLPTGPTHEALKKFRHRTLYANSVNDGIVPLRTSAILYLDWRGLGKAARAKRGEAPDSNGGTPKKVESEESIGGAGGGTSTSADGSATTAAKNESTNSVNDVTGEIPEDNHESEPKTKDGFLQTFTKQSNDLMDSITGPFNSLLSFLAPQAGGKKPGKIYERSQTINEEIESSSKMEEKQSKKNGKKKDDEGHEIPKKTSMIESGVSVLLPPLPSQNFIVDPAQRPSVIFHDKYYTEDDLPKRRFKAKTSLFSPITPKKLDKSFSFSSASSNKSAASSSDSTTKDVTAESTNFESNLVEKAKVEEKIAREWHRELKWRKVLVRLEPDAHNNIVVRRRFSNAYGWPVIDHLVENHFGALSDDNSENDETITVKAKATHKKDGDSRKPSRLMRPIDILRQHPELKEKHATHAVPGHGQSHSGYSTEEDELARTRQRDLSGLSIDTSVPDNKADESSPVTSTNEISSPASHQFLGNARKRRSSTLGSSKSSEHSSSNKTAWDLYLHPDEDESEDEGIVHNVGSWIDNIRDISNLNINSFVDTTSTSGSTTEPVTVLSGEEDTSKDLSDIALEQSANY